MTPKLARICASRASVLLLAIAAAVTFSPGTARADGAEIFELPAARPVVPAPGPRVTASTIFHDLVSFLVVRDGEASRMRASRIELRPWFAGFSGAGLGLSGSLCDIMCARPTDPATDRRQP